MKEITRVHLAKVPYEIEIEAKKDLEKYLNALKKYSGDESIFQDVEVRMTEILAENGVLENGIISKNDVTKIRAQIGEPEVFKGDDFDGSVSDSSDENDEKSNSREQLSYFEKLKKRKLYRIRENSVIDGVCAGLAEYFGVETTLMRILAFVSIFMTAGLTILVYLVLDVIMPTAKSANDILRLRGEPISAEGIRKINEEFDFEKSKNRDQKIRRVIGILLGSMAVIATVIGFWLIVVGNIALQKFFHEGSAMGLNENARLLLVVLSNFAGIVFVVFWLTLASVGFTLKFTRNHFISIMMCLALGISSAVGFATIAMESAQKANVEISKSLKISNIKFEEDKLSKITKIENNSNFEVEYFVSDKRKIEIGEYQFFEQDLAKNTEFQFEGEVLRIRSNQSRKAWISSDDGAYKVRIYGPELSNIVTYSDFDYHISKNQTLPLEVVVENDAFADFEIRGIGVVQDLKIFTRDYHGNLYQVKDRGEFYED